MLQLCISVYLRGTALVSLFLAHSRADSIARRYRECCATGQKKRLIDQCLCVFGEQTVLMYPSLPPAPAGSPLNQRSATRWGATASCSVRLLSSGC
ncbi:hypothetical protein I7I48_11822 [Histoplasma ohiense]|nr:hypothetical protein I7I48_11822 [Histoplasma ohiense (nom. inval.)]